MPGYFIYRCEQSPFDAWKFKDSKGKEMTVEGKITSKRTFESDRANASRTWTVAISN